MQQLGTAFIIQASFYHSPLGEEKKQGWGVQLRRYCDNPVLGLGADHRGARTNREAVAELCWASD